MKVVEGEEEEDRREEEVPEEGREEVKEQRMHGKAMDNLYRGRRDGIRDQRHDC